MRPTATRGSTNNFQPPENWDQEKDGPCGDLQVRMQLHGERGLFEMVSTWKPDASELAHLNRGGVVELAITSTGHPAVGLSVVDPVGLQSTDQVSLDSEPITINESAHGDDSHGGPEEDQFGYGGRGVSGG
jgi:hypothetical protein